MLHKCLCSGSFPILVLKEEVNRCGLMMPGKREYSLCRVARPLLGSKAVRQRGRLALCQRVCNPRPHTLPPGDLALVSSFLPAEEPPPLSFVLVFSNLCQCIPCSAEPLPCPGSQLLLFWKTEPASLRLPEDMDLSLLLPQAATPVPGLFVSSLEQ